MSNKSFCKISHLLPIASLLSIIFLNLFLRSTYFIQIEEDVKNHASAIKEMKTAIATFQTSDMSELIKFHKFVESHLEKLTDESQVYSY